MGGCLSLVQIKEEVGIWKGQCETHGATLEKQMYRTTLASTLLDLICCVQAESNAYIPDTLPGAVDGLVHPVYLIK